MIRTLLILILISPAICTAETEVLETTKVDDFFKSKSGGQNGKTRSLFKARGGPSEPQTRSISGLSLDLKSRGPSSPWKHNNTANREKPAGENTPSLTPSTSSITPQQKIPPVELEVKVEQNVSLDFPIAFLRGSANINANDVNSLNNLTTIASKLKDNSKVKLLLLGQTCDIGASDKNDVLSMKRAFAVYQALLARGVSTEQLNFVGQGERNVPAHVKGLNDSPKNEKLRSKLRKVTLHKLVK